MERCIVFVVLLLPGVMGGVGLWWITSSIHALAQDKPSAPVEVASAAQEPPAPELPQEKQLLPYPPELTIESFASMRLEGTDMELGDVLVDDPLYTSYAMTYRSNGVKISGILNIPKGSGAFPLILVNHGYFPLDMYHRGMGMHREMSILAKNGYAAVHTDYREHALSDPNPDPRNLYDGSLGYAMDVVNVLDALRRADIPEVDTTRVGMLGHSMGGDIAMNILTAYPHMVKALVMQAPANADAWKNFERWKLEEPYAKNTLQTWGTREENPETWDALSSKTYLNRLDVPILLYQGDDDGIVPKRWNDELHEELVRLGKDVRYIVLQGEPHEFGEDWITFARDFLLFFNKHLKGKGSL